MFESFRSHLDGHSCWQALKSIDESNQGYFSACRNVWDLSKDAVYKVLKFDREDELPVREEFLYPLLNRVL